MEQWRVIPRWEQYEINRQGAIRSLHKCRRGHLMSTYVRNGYPTVVLSRNGIWKHQHVHRLLALAFLPNPKNKRYVVHLDCNSENYELDNLRWATAQELAKFRRSSQYLRNILSTARKDYRPNLLAELNEAFTVIRNIA